MHFLDRALIVHWNGFGWLGIPYVSQRNEQTTKDPDLMVPSTYSATGSISLPELSNSLEMLKTASDMAHEMNTDASAKCNPGPVMCMFSTKVISDMLPHIFVCQIQNKHSWDQLLASGR